jgi:ATP-dependent phosphoenolpyruvate carboxykinase
MKVHGTLYATEAKKAFKENFENVSLENIQAAILIGSTCLGDSDPNATSLYFGTSLSPATTLSAHASLQCLPIAWCR